MMQFLSEENRKFFVCSYRAALWRLNQFWLELLYLMFFSMLGFITLLALDSQKPAGSSRIGKPDLFFMSVSTHTGSRLASINMEDLSDSQLMVLIFLMFVGGEVFLSALTLLFKTVDFTDGEPATEAAGGDDGEPATEVGGAGDVEQATEAGDVEQAAEAGGGDDEPSTEAVDDSGRRRRVGLIALSRDQGYLRLRSMRSPGHVAVDVEHAGYVENSTARSDADADDGLQRRRRGRRPAATAATARSDSDDDVELAGCAFESIAVRGDQDDLRLRSMRSLGLVALSFHVFVCILGSSTVLAYFRLVPSARAVLQKKGLGMATFSVFTTVSSFVNCGFLPNNENMVVFNGNSGFLLMATAQILVGNTLFAPCLSLMIWALQKWRPRKEYEFLWNKGHELGYGHLFHWKTSAYIALSNVAFTVVQFAMFGLLQWGSAAGLTVYQKLVAGLFQSVNARHAGETAFDLSGFSAALLVVYMVMMFLPPYTCFLPLKIARLEKAGKDNCGSSGEEKEEGRGSGEGEKMKYLLLPQAAYLVIFVVLICLTGRRLLDDNFNALTVAFEVASAYGNVGLTTGYSCGRMHKLSNLPCTDSWTSFSGRWSWRGKAIIIVVMFFGRLKRFTKSGGKAWVTL